MRQIIIEKKLTARLRTVSRGKNSTGSESMRACVFIPFYLVVNGIRSESLVRVANTFCGYTIPTFSRPTQPGHPSVCRCNEY